MNNVTDHCTERKTKKRSSESSNLGSSNAVLSRRHLRPVNYFRSGLFTAGSAKSSVIVEVKSPLLERKVL